MANFKQRYREFISACNTVRDLYTYCNNLDLEFKCSRYVAEPYDTDFIVECAGEGYCFDTVVVEKLCEIYSVGEYCLDTSCPHNRWNKKYVDSQKKLRAARKERNRAFWNLFRIRQK